MMPAGVLVDAVLIALTVGVRHCFGHLLTRDDRMLIVLIGGRGRTLIVTKANQSVALIIIARLRRHGDSDARPRTNSD
jgi:hypothetical protein